MDRQQAVVPNDRILVELVETMFATDDRGRLTGHAPHLYILRTPESVICRCHADLADEIATMLEELSARPRGRPREWAREYADYLGVLSPVASFTSMRAGQLYRFPALLGFESTCLSIVQSNADLLRGGLDEWLPDVAAGLPMMAMVAEGRAVSICASVIASRTVHCAGLKHCRTTGGEGWPCRPLPVGLELYRRVARRHSMAPLLITSRLNGLLDDWD
jgi:hypothetical protein